MSDSPLRLALVGHPDDTVVWHDAAARLQGGHVALAVESLQSVLDNQGSEIDAVVLCSLSVMELSAAREAAEATKHIMAAAPVVESLRQAEALIGACRQANVCFAVGNTLRCMPAYQTIMERLSSGRLGDPGLLRVHRWSANSGFTLSERIFGDVDLAIWLFGSQPTEVHALGRRGEAETNPDYLQIHFGFPVGGMAVLDFSASLPDGRGYDSLSLIGSRGAAYADDHHNVHLLFRGGDPAALISDPSHGHLLQELQAFVDAIHRHAPPPVGGSDCRAVHQVIEAVTRSLDSGKVLHERGGCYEPA